jgi:hypothetical protein
MVWPGPNSHGRTWETWEMPLGDAAAITHNCLERLMLHYL